MNLKLLLALAPAAIAGCASTRPIARSSAPVPPSAPVPSSAPAALPAPAPISPPDLPEPIYRNPKIGVVLLRAHRDAEGRLFGPQTLYQVIDPGGWNVSAADSGRGYIPAANAEAAPNLGLPGESAESAPPPAPDSPWRDAALAARVVITGLMRPEDRAQAEAMARLADHPCLAVYDDQAGWLLVPTSPPAVR